MKKLLIATILSTLSLTAVASPIEVNGVVWDPTVGSDFSAVASIFENSITETDNKVTGYGRVSEINGTSVSEFCPACELTYVTTFIVNLTSSASFTMSNLLVSFFVDDTPDFTANAPRLANAMDGLEWLTLADHEGMLSGTGGNLTLPTAYGNGNGFMDVTGGLAASYFDTNAMFDFSDLEMSSSFHKNVNAKETGYNLSGSIFVNGDTRAVPTPSVLWLVVIGAVSMVSLKRKTA